MTIIPFEKSFASNPKSQYWNNEKNGDVNPRQVFISSIKKYWFNCQKCNHDFETKLNNITNNDRWCPFCANKQLCKNESCQLCYEKSFAYHPKSQYWNNEKNGDVNPRQVFISSGKKFWFNCGNCSHDFETTLNNITSNQHWCSFCANQQLCNNESCQLCCKKSFASHPKSQYWNNEKNGGLTPRQVFISSHKKFWFNCCNCSHNFETALNNITSNQHWCPFCTNQQLCENISCQLCYKKSFASHPKSQYWNNEKNGDVKPRQIFISSIKKYCFKCYNCDHSFESIISNITNKTKPKWCPFCSTPSKNLCKNESCQLCYKKSFASHPKSQYWNNEKNGDVKPRQVFLSSNKKFWFNCQKCNHDFETKLNNITNNDRWCPFCTNQQLCGNESCQLCYKKSFASHPKSQYWNNEKNEDVKPRQVFLSSNKKFWFNCETCNHDFESVLNNITQKDKPQWCSHCINKTETKLYKSMLLYFPTIIKQFKQEWCKNIKYLPFDFCILEHKIIIELDGRQHFQQISNWRSPTEQYQIDKYKEECANKNGYSVIRIIQENVWADKYDWLKELLEAIENIKSNDGPTNIYLCKNNEYQYY